MTKKSSLFIVTLPVAIFTVALFAFTLTAHAAGPWFVSPTGNNSNDCLSAATACLTINAAIVKASNGEVVNVAAGVYVENVSLNKSLTLSGAQAGVDARGRLAAESIIVPPSGIGLTLLTGSAGATIDGFMIAGGTRGIESQSGPLDGLTIQNNRIVAFTDGGIFLNDIGTDMTVNQNAIDGTSKTTSGGSVHLDTDAMDGFWFTNNDVVNGVTGAGLFSDGTRNVGVSGTRSPKMTNNLFQADDVGVNLGRKSWEFADISNNTFKNNDFDGFQGGPANSTIANNLFDNNARSGLALTGFGGGADATRGAQNNTVTLNTFTGNDVEGIFLSTSQFAGTISTNVINRNSIAGNAFGFRYGGTESINAECNWWGNADGPGPVGPGSGDTVGASATIDFISWLTTSDLVGDACAGGGPAPDVTVTIVKYVDGVHATAGNANSLSFPINASWNAVNIGAGAGSFALSAVGFNNPNPYEATTASMTSGADYSASEDTTGPNVGASCADNKPFALAGYSIGDTEVAAAGAATSSSAVLTSIATSKWIIVHNVTCPGTLIVKKQYILDNGGTPATTTVSFKVNGGSSTFFEADAQNDLSVSSGLFSVVEDAAAGFTTTYSNSQNGNANCTNLDVEPGQTVTCTITNNDDFVPTPPPPANACNTPGVAPLGYTLQNGTAGNDNVTIAPFTMFVGLGGYDTVNGPAAGNYIVCTGTKADKITLGNGDFTINAGDGYNVIVTGNGTGYIEGGVDADKITTGDGVQTIQAGNGYNNIVTGNGDKNITAGIKADQITTGSGNDVINAGVGYNNIKSGAGNDSITTGADNDTIDGGPDTDTCNAGGGYDSVVNCEA